jgi:hypothetical protein
MSSFRKNGTIGLIIIGTLQHELRYEIQHALTMANNSGTLLTLTVILAAVGIVITALSLIVFFMSKYVNEYVVTNVRAMHLNFGKVY